MKIEEIMSTRLIMIKPDASIRDAARKMVKHGISGLIVVAKAYDLSGIITERDILKAFASGKDPNTEISRIMRKKVLTASPQDTLEEAASIMAKHRVKRLPVVSKNICVGMVTASDLIRYEERLIETLSTLFIIPQKAAEAG